MEDCVKMVNKRGAMELSINTIIIIVIAIKSSINVYAEFRFMD